jgi:glycosyltransferase involved in cell wall biosynthesis
MNVLMGRSGIAWEIIVVDDASPDGTQEVARQLAGIYGEDKVVRRQLHSNAPTPGAESPVRSARGALGVRS